jgi:carbon-monoxide dehydrogenase medium subunit
LYLPDVELHESSTLDEAFSLLGRFGRDARILAGGTDLLVDLKSGRRSARHLVSINGISSLRGVSTTDEGLRIGALTTLSELDRDPRVRDGNGFAALRDATSRMAAVQIRNMATVGGNVACAVPCADLPPILTVLRAWVTLRSPLGERRVPMDALFTGVRRTVLRADEILTEVGVPAQRSGEGAAYERFALRDGNAIAVAAVAAGLQLAPDGTIADAGIVLGAVSPTPKLVRKANQLLVGRRPDDGCFDDAAIAATEEAEPISDVRGTAEFRRRLVGVLTRRALTAALARARENAA